MDSDETRFLQGCIFRQATTIGRQTEELRRLRSIVYMLKPSADIRIGTGLLDINGEELKEGDKCRFVSGPYSRKPFKDMIAEVVWNHKGMWSLKWSDGINNYWIENPEKLQIIKD